MGRGANSSDATVVLRRPRSGTGAPVWSDAVGPGVRRPLSGGRRDWLLDLLRTHRLLPKETLEAYGMDWQEVFRHFSSLTDDGYVISYSSRQAELLEEPEVPFDGRQIMLDVLRAAAPAGVTIDELVAAGVPEGASRNGHWGSLTDEGYILRFETQDGRGVMTLLEDLPGA